MGTLDSVWKHRCPLCDGALRMPLEDEGASGYVTCTPISVVFHEIAVCTECHVWVDVNPRTSIDDQLQAFKAWRDARLRIIREQLLWSRLDDVAFAD